MKKTLNLADFKALESLVEQVVDKKLDIKLEPIHESINGLYSLVDGYLKKTEDWHQEFIVLRAQHNQMKHVLVNKNIASEQELSITAS